MKAGLLVVDKPQGVSSHGVVAAVRRILQTKKVGHAGTLDPMATGVLVLGVGRATKLLGYISADTKSYQATIRLGVGTDSEDADGQVVETPGVAGISAEDIDRAVAELTGDILQVPSTFSAIKVDGKRAYALARSGEAPTLVARPVSINSFTRTSQLTPIDGSGVDAVDFTVEVDCSSGTYVRALARDLGQALGSAAHLVALRRTRVGPFSLTQAKTLPALEEAVAEDEPVLVPLSQAVADQFPVLLVTDQSFERFYKGQRLDRDLSFLPGDVELARKLEAEGSVFAVARDTDQREPFALVRLVDGRLKSVLHLLLQEQTNKEDS